MLLNSHWIQLRKYRAFTWEVIAINFAHLFKSTGCLFLLVAGEILWSVITLAYGSWLHLLLDSFSKKITRWWLLGWLVQWIFSVLVCWFWIQKSAASPRCWLQRLSCINSHIHGNHVNLNPILLEGYARNYQLTLACAFSISILHGRSSNQLHFSNWHIHLRSTYRLMFVFHEHNHLEEVIWYASSPLLFYYLIIYHFYIKF